jgi:hypothetical protein
MTKNNINEPVSSFLKTMKKSNASRKESSIFTPSAISVIKTLFSPPEKKPLKKIKSEMKATRANPAINRIAEDKS